MVNSGNNIFLEGMKTLQERLPPEWKVTLAPQPMAHFLFSIQAPDKRKGMLLAEARRRLEPRDVLALVTQMRGKSVKEVPLVVSPYLSPGVRERLREASIGFVDFTGNIHLALAEPGLFIETRGANRDPDPKERPSRSLRGSKAGRIIRLLLDQKAPPGVRELAKSAEVDPGYVSRVLSLLNREALIEQQGRGRIVKVDWVRLLRRWAADAPLCARGEQTACIAPRGLGDFQSQLNQKQTGYAVTGTLAASQYAPVAPPRLMMVYVENAAEAISAFGLKITSSGTNVILIEPHDPGVFVGKVMRGGLNVVRASQAAADLLTSPGRGPAEAEALIEWMTQNEEQWRG